MRSLLLFLSRRHGLRAWMEASAPARRLAARFVAGDTLEEALEVSRRLAGAGITVTLDHLGESVTSLEEAAQASVIYRQALEAMRQTGLEPNVSLKLTQMGLDLSLEACRGNVGQLVARAAEIGGFVRVDMESSQYTDRTLQLVMDWHARQSSVGVVIQAYLHRSRADVEKLCRLGIRVRLCKGAYLEPHSAAFPHKRQVDANYIELMKLLLDTGTYPAIATHDEKMIAATQAHAAARGLGRNAFEFQMLYGIRSDLQRRLAREGYRVRLYLPFGRAWYPYYMRRLAERPANVSFILRHLWRRE